VRHVPPLQFLIICIGSDQLKGWMQNIRKSTLKWSGFIGGMSDSMAREKASGRLLQELPGFLLILKKKQQLLALEQAIEKSNWSGFVDTLLK